MTLPTSVRKVRVLVNGPLSDRIGGMETYCRDYLSTALPYEFEIRTCRAILLPSVFTTHGILRICLRALNAVLVTLVWIGALTRRRPDIAHIHTNSFGGFYVKGILAILARLAGAHSILHVHGAQFDDFFNDASRAGRTAIRYLLSASSVVIVLSKGWRRFFSSIGVPDDRLVVMANATFLPVVSARLAALRPLNVLFMARFERRKGVHELVRAIQNNADLRQSCQFVLAGPQADDWEFIAQAAHDQELSSCVELPGAKTGSDREQALREADVFVLQSFAEGMPIGLLEAMSYGLTCITTPVGGIPDVIQHGRNGLLITPGDADGLAEALRLLASDRTLVQRLGREARATIEREFSWAVRERELAGVYRQLAKTRP